MILSLSAEVVATIAAECVRAPGVETGGVLAGVADAGWAIALQASGPGEGAALDRYRLRWDPMHVAIWLAGEVWPGTAPIGRWHKHCGPILMASEADRVGADALREALQVQAVVDVIVATDHDEPIAFAAYLSTAAGYERIEVQHPTGISYV